MFQHTAARRRLVSTGPIVTTVPEGFNTQPPEGGWAMRVRALWRVSCFNTQPPEGGWQKILIPFEQNTGFNTQPPEGGWVKRIFECT